MHLADVCVTRTGRFVGMVKGTLTIAAGCDVDMAGMVGGMLVVEPGATVRVSGMVRGGIVDQGGSISVSGMIGR